MKDTTPTTLRIEARTWEDPKEKALERARKFDVQRLLTPKRLELIQRLMTEEVGSIRELAEVLDCNPSEVHDDVHTLEECSVVELREEGRGKKPVVPYDDIDISVNLSRENAAGVPG